MVQWKTALIYTLVSVLLVLGVCYRTGEKVRPKRLVLGAVLAGGYALGCLQWRFWGSMPVRLGQIALLAVTVFGFSRRSLQRGILLLVLYAALEGLCLGLFAGTAGGMVLAVLSLGMLWAAAREKGEKGAVAVQLCFRGQKLELTALRDTGHFLTDPLTGRDVLIAGSDIAYRLLGLTAAQLRDPVAVMAKGEIPRLRLIPCRTVTGSAMLLAVQCDWVRIDGRRTSPLVAFSPEKLGLSEDFQALTGGNHG